jgi:hypothetical protein
MKQSVYTQHLIEFKKLIRLYETAIIRRYVSEISKGNHTALAIKKKKKNFGLGLTLIICKCYDTFGNYNWGFHPVAVVQYTFTHKQHTVAVVQYTFTHKQHTVAVVQYTFTHKQHTERHITINI